MKQVFASTLIPDIFEEYSFQNGDAHPDVKEKISDMVNGRTNVSGVVNCTLLAKDMKQLIAALHVALNEVEKYD